jgi:superoxide dismutase, Fe-Mn family
MAFSNIANQKAYPFALPVLPYDKNDLLPHMSSETFEYHHEKHHAAYVSNLNKILEDKQDIQTMSLEDLIMMSHKESIAPIFNNAAQVWNHSFFWHSMKKNGGGSPEGELLELIERDFVSFEKFSEGFIQSGISQFGSGWVWLVRDPSGKLKIVKTSNAELPITSGDKPLICCDVWEHAYYVDYRNKRPDFLSVFLKNLVNWEFAESNL